MNKENAKQGMKLIHTDQYGKKEPVTVVDQELFKNSSFNGPNTVFIKIDSNDNLLAVSDTNLTEITDLDDIPS